LSLFARGSFNNITYVTQKVPTLYTALSVGSFALNPLVYGINSNPFVVKYNQTVDLTVNNLDRMGHPMHLHGHTFQVLERSAVADRGPRKGVVARTPDAPMRRDTVVVDAGGRLIIRFRANNPDRFPSLPLSLTYPKKG
jgi:iron transport multicopper oxidase